MPGVAAQPWVPLGWSLQWPQCEGRPPLLVRDDEATAGAHGCGQPWLASSALCAPCISGGWQQRLVTAHDARFVLSHLLAAR